MQVEVWSTPGHTPESISLVVRHASGAEPSAVLTGDTVLGRGTTVVAYPDGRLGAYLDSLDRLHALAEAHDIDVVWPGHGPVVEDALAGLDYYISHRQERLAQVEAAVNQLQAGGIADAVTLPRQVVEIVYADVDPVLWGAAELSVRAQLDYLRGEGCDEMQGYLFSEPLPAEEIPAFLESYVGRDPGMVQPLEVPPPAEAPTPGR